MTLRKQNHAWVFMRGRGWMDLYVYGSPKEFDKWRVRQFKIRDVVQVKECEGCVDCEEIKSKKELTA